MPPLEGYVFEGGGGKDHKMKEKDEEGRERENIHGTPVSCEERGTFENSSRTPDYIKKQFD